MIWYLQYQSLYILSILFHPQSNLHRKFIITLFNTHIFLIHVTMLILTVVRILVFSTTANLQFFIQTLELSN